MNIIEVPVKDLISDPNNARSHNKKNMDAIRGSLARFGQQKPIVVNSKNIVIAGNGTLAAANSLGWKTVKCVITGLDGFNSTAFAIADNRTSELAEWDDDVLNKTLKALAEQDFDLTDIGFDPFGETPEKSGANDDEEITTRVNHNNVKHGDVFALGESVLVCGDSYGDAKKVIRLIKLHTDKPEMVFSDPPYEIDNEYMRIYDHAMFDHSHMFTMRDDVGLVDYLRKSRHQFRRFFIADHLFQVPTGNVPYKRHIAIAHEHSPDAVSYKTLLDGDSTIFKMKYRGNIKDSIHEHQKPCNLLENLMNHWTEPGGWVVDLFAGSGTTLLSAHNTNRKCITFEIDPISASNIIDRFRKCTGIEPVQL